MASRRDRGRNSVGPMKQNDIVVTAREIEIYKGFVQCIFNCLSINTAKLPEMLWHYTNSNGVKSIIESGSIFTTQIGCLNDSSEIMYSVDMLRSAMSRLRSKSEISAIPEIDRILFTIADEELSVDVRPFSEWFVACLSELSDDLSQWRAYSGGENGFAIGFRTDVLIQISYKNYKSRFKLAKISYDQNFHHKIVDLVAEKTLEFCRAGYLMRSGCDPSVWVNEFLLTWRNYLTYLTPVLKHPSFSSEMRVAFNGCPARRRLQVPKICCERKNAQAALAIQLGPRRSYAVWKIYRRSGQIQFDIEN